MRTKLRHFLRLFWGSQNRKSVIFELAPGPRSVLGAPAPTYCTLPLTVTTPDSMLPQATFQNSLELPKNITRSKKISLDFKFQVF